MPWARFLRAHPGVELSLAVANTEEIARQVANFQTWPNRSAYHPHPDLHAAQLRRCWTQLLGDAADNGGLCRPPRVYYYRQSRARSPPSAGGIPKRRGCTG